MKKGTKGATLLAAITLLTMVGCGKSTPEYTFVAGDSASTEISMEDSDDDTDNEESTEKEDSEDSEDSEDESEELSDISFEYDGKKVSVMDDVKITLENLGKYNKERSELNRETGNYYNYDSGISYETTKLDGQEVPMYLYINHPGIFTAKGIGVGNSEEDVIAAYGDPALKHEDQFVYALTYNYGACSLTFTFDANKKVEMFFYEDTNVTSRVDYS